MRRVIAIALAGASLGGCSSLSWDGFKSTPPAIQVQLESSPPGADARTSLGPACKTPCAVSIAPTDEGFSVTYTLDKHEAATVPVQVIRTPGDIYISASTTTDPSPVFAELQRTAPLKPARKPGPKKPKAPRTASPAATDSPFPNPGTAIALPGTPSR